MVLMENPENPSPASEKEPATNAAEAPVSLPIKEVADPQSFFVKNRTLVIVLSAVVGFFSLAVIAWYFFVGRSQEGVEVVAPPPSSVGVALQGSVADQIDGVPLGGVVVRSAGRSAVSDVEGIFSIFVSGTGMESSSLTFELDGYRKYTGAYAASAKTEVKLVPEGKVVFVSNRDGDQAIYTANFDSSESEKLIQNKKGSDDSGPLLSPNKKYLAFYSTRDGERDNYGNLIPRLYLYNIENGALAKLSEETNLSYVTWLSDSSGLIYLSSKYETGKTSSYRINFVGVTGSEKTLIDNSHFKPYEASDSAYFSQPVLSSDSRRLAFSVSQYQHPDNEGIYAMMVSGGSPWKVSSRRPSSSLEFSDDGESLEFDYYGEDKKQRFSISVIDSSEREIPLEESRYYCPGEYSGYGGEGGAGGGGGYCTSSEILAADETVLAFTDFRDGKRDVYVSDPDGENERRLTVLGGVGQLYWGPGDRYLLFSVSQENERAIYILGLREDNEPLKITDIFGSFAGVIL